MFRQERPRDNRTSDEFSRENMQFVRLNLVEERQQPPHNTIWLILAGEKSVISDFING